MTSSTLSPQNSPAAILRQVWKSRRELPGAVNPWSMFPVDVDEVARHVEPPWKVERVAQLGHVFEAAPVDSAFLICGRKDGQTDPKTRTILVGIDGVSDERVRFTIAHEIGHAVLHGTISAMRVRPLRRDSASRKAQQAAPTREEQADAFAAELLMPEKAVRLAFLEIFGTPAIWASEATRYVSEATAIEQFGGDARDAICVAASVALASATPVGKARSMTRLFGVSPTAMGKRLRALRLVRP